MKNLALTVLFSLSLTPLTSAVPEVMSHQGRIVVDGINLDGTGYFKFAFTDAGASQSFWAHDGTSSGEPVSVITVPVVKGHYSIILGDPGIVNMTTPVAPAIFTENDDVHLQIWFSTVPGGPFELLTPSRRVCASGYALSAAKASSLTTSYLSGEGSDYEFLGVTTNTLSLSTTFSESFSTPPTVSASTGWTIAGTTVDGFTTSTSFSGQTVDPGGLAGKHASLAVIAGRPAIAYRDDNGGKLMFVRALDSSGMTWSPSSIIRVDGALNDAGQYASLADVAGHPAISYYDSSSGDLRFARAEDAAGTSWPTPLTVDGASSNVGRDCSLAVVGGVPAIAYQAPNSGKILYAWAADAAGTTWPAANRVAVEGSLSAYRLHPCLKEVDGKPAIAFYNQSDGDLRYAWFSGSDLSDPADWTAVDADTSGNVGANPSLAVIGGHPAISYTGAGGNVNYVRASDATGSSWGSVISIGSGREASLADIGGRPAVSYFDSTVGDLILAIGGDPAGTSWPAGNRVTVDGQGSIVGTHSSLAIVADLPAMAYHDETNLDLKFASLPAASWSASRGDAEPILASGIKDGGVTETMLSPSVGVWTKSGDDLLHLGGKIGVGRTPLRNALEVEGTASKTVAGSWVANSDRRIKSGIREIENATEALQAVRLVEFDYTPEYRAAHPEIKDQRYPNVIAQNFAKVFPEWVTGSGEMLPNGGGEILQVDTYPLTIYSAAAVQELAAENAALRKRIERLEKKLEEVLLRVAPSKKLPEPITSGVERNR